MHARFGKNAYRILTASLFSFFFSYVGIIPSLPSDAHAATFFHERGEIGLTQTMNHIDSEGAEDEEKKIDSLLGFWILPASTTRATPMGTRIRQVVLLHAVKANIAPRSPPTAAPVHHAN